MSVPERQGLSKRQGLTQKELDEIRQLMDVCNAYEGLDLKLNWETLRTRPSGQTNDFLYYEQGVLVGFLALFNFNSQEAEISGMVHPEYRRRGIFTTLLDETREECRRRGLPKILFIVEHASRSGQAFVAQLHPQYDHSEYKMELVEAKLPGAFDAQLHFRQAGPEDATVLAHITAVSFGMSENEVNWYGAEARDGRRRYYVVLLDDVCIGKIDVSFGEQEAFIYGFGVLPEYRGRGYGRQILARTIQEILATGRQHVLLEVAVENRRALSLYQSCGFREMGSYDYYALAVGAA